METEKIKIGQMDHRVEIVQKTRTKSSTGAETETNETICTVWAKRTTASTDKILDDKVVALNVNTYEFRYQPVLKTYDIQDLFLIDDGLEFEIYGFEIIGRNRYYKFKCQIRG